MFDGEELVGTTVTEYYEVMFDGEELLGTTVTSWYHSNQLVPQKI
jgi:hypothetical protein